MKPFIEMSDPVSDGVEKYLFMQYIAIQYGARV